MTDLSPAAQAIWDAWESEWSKGSFCHEERFVAAALRAAADQVVSETTTPWNSTLTPMISVGEVRAKILAIAAELEGGND